MSKKIYCGESVRPDAVNLSAVAVVARSLPRGLEVNANTMQFERVVQNCAKKNPLKGRKPSKQSERSSSFSLLMSSAVL